MPKIDVSQQVAEMERTLRANEDRARCLTAIAILRRWQHDEMLDDVSRQRAKALVLEFGSIFAE